MEDYGLDLHASMILDDFREKLPQFEQLKTIVVDQLWKVIRKSGIEINTIEARVKTEASFAGKLQRKGHKYQSLDDITDIVGARVITFYNEDVDRIASIMETIFEVDWANSVDKRKMHQVSSFGYNSLHYVCRLRREVFHDDNCPWFNEVRFEIQMRTALQHVWSAIEHDTGYKTEIEVPAEYMRSLSRLSGLLELADNEFSRLRQELADYRHRTRALVQKGKLDEVELNGDTFRTYMAQQTVQSAQQTHSGHHAGRDSRGVGHALSVSTPDAQYEDAGRRGALHQGEQRRCLSVGLATVEQHRPRYPVVNHRSAESLCCEDSEGWLRQSRIDTFSR